MNYFNNENEQKFGALKAAFFAGLILNVCVVWAGLQNSATQKHAEIDSRLNPNVASVYELAELPSIGPAKAGAIVDYRQHYGGECKAFEVANDLKKVKGIGEKTANKIKGWLVFE